MTENTQAPRGPHRTGPVLSSTGEAPSATAKDAIGAPSERIPGQTALTAPTSVPAPSAADTTTVEPGRGRLALLSALALRGTGTARSAEGADSTDDERHRPGRPVLAVAAIAGLLLVAAPFGLSAAKEQQSAAPLQGDLASGSTGSLPDQATAAASGTGVQGYVPEVQPDSPAVPGSDSGAAPGAAAADPGSAAAGATGGSGDGLPERSVEPSFGGPQGAPLTGVSEDDEDDEDEEGDGNGGDGNDGNGVGEPLGVSVEEGSLLALLLAERNGKGEEPEESAPGKGAEEDTEEDTGDDDGDDDGDGELAGTLRAGDEADPLSAAVDQGFEALSEGVESTETEAEDSQPESAPAPEPAPTPDPFRAVAGPGCQAEGARYQVNGEGVWRSGPAGYSDSGCDDGYDVMAVSGDPDGGGTSAEWTFWPGRPDATCTVKILVQNGPDPLWANGVPTHYELFDGENADGSFRGGFEVTQPDDGRYWALVELHDVGESFTLRARNRGAIPEGGEAPQLPLSVVEAECS